MHPVHSFFFATIHRPPSSTLFPYTTLFRSWLPQSKYLEPHARHRSQQIAFLVTGGSRRSREPPASSELQVQPCIHAVGWRVQRTAPQLEHPVVHAQSHQIGRASCRERG